MSSEDPKLQIEIDASRPAVIVNSAVVVTSEIVSFHFNALAGADLNKPAEPHAVMYRFLGPELSAAQRRAMHERWILAKAFQELLRAVRHALEVAHVLSALLTKKHKIKSPSMFADFLKPLSA